MKITKLLAITLLLSGCMISPQQKGTLTTSMIGTKGLTEKGDQLMGTGVYAKREVSADFAEGYEKGLSDATKQDYWSMQEAQRWVGH
jgi:hypothetical protein